MNKSNSETLTLPLWKGVLADIRTRAEYGMQIKTDWLEHELRADRDSLEFVFAVQSIRDGLIESGFFLSAQGAKGEHYYIKEANENVDVMSTYHRKASNSIARAVMLGARTDISKLTDEEKRKHERKLEKMQIKAALLRLPIAKARAAIAQSEPPKIEE